jgi:hypothetical protein
MGKQAAKKVETEAAPRMLSVPLDPSLYTLANIERVRRSTTWRTIVEEGLRLVVESEGAEIR